MRNRANLALMEQLVMVLVFAVAAVLCLRAFLWAEQTSRDLELRDRAMVLCQNTAEQLKQSGDPAMLGARQQGDLWILHRAGTGQPAFRIEIRKEAPPVANMGMAVIRCFREDSDTPLFSLRTGWQEVTP